MYVAVVIGPLIHFVPIRHSQHYKLEESNLILGMSGCVSYIFLETNDNTISKKWIP